MARRSKNKSKAPHESLAERIHDRFVAAEVAAEEAAGYGPGTSAVEAFEGAADPDREDEEAEREAGEEGSKPAT